MAPKVNDDSQPTSKERERVAASFVRTHGGPNPYYECKACGESVPGLRSYLLGHLESCAAPSDSAPGDDAELLRHLDEDSTEYVHGYAALQLGQQMGLAADRIRSLLAERESGAAYWQGEYNAMQTRACDAESALAEATALIAELVACKTTREKMDATASSSRHRHLRDWLEEHEFPAWVAAREFLRTQEPK